MIKFRNLTITQQYVDLIVDIISRVEGFIKNIEDINDSKATIGYGYTFNRNNNVEIWQKTRITLSAPLWSVLQEIDNAPADQKTAIALNQFNKSLTIKYRAPSPITLSPITFLGLTVLALCSFNTHADDIKSMHKIEFNKTSPKAMVLELLQSSHYANESPPNVAYYEEFDLNNDNSNEYFLYINDPGWCGAGNCPMFIFEKKMGTIRPLLEVSSGPIVFILNHKINNYYDISFFPDGEVNRNIWHWNGKQYE